MQAGDIEQFQKTKIKRNALLEEIDMDLNPTNESTFC